uniref:Ovule protein n=1 Tax=Ascaris lumbricoides TaxID=6252 RepID=A0A0M3ITW9_ASCLU
LQCTSSHLFVHLSKKLLLNIESIIYLSGTFSSYYHF